jgi:hypothetical protein
VLVADEVVDGEILQTQPVVGLDELTGDLVQKAATNIGNAGVVAGQLPDCLGLIA